METITFDQIVAERKSVRKYKPGVQIPNQILDNIFSLAGKAPSSWNLQHWRFLIIKTQEKKERIYPIAWNQEQVLDSSCVVIVLGDTEAYKNAEKIYQRQVDLGYMSEDLMNHYLLNLPNIYKNKENFAIHEAIRNASLASMLLMLAAKNYGIDSCPMIGFKEDELRNELHIPDRYIPVMMITLGYQLDSTVPHSTIRLPLDDYLFEETFTKEEFM
ncbi:nitroreductase family protein [Bacillus sp. CGMCC 1.16607]|uniref:nitroreductase family protein n=1 Tax=Bacillus sp. CGMCC 1.16607 TaxID=3351842 RepID=UPI003637C0C5